MTGWIAIQPAAWRVFLAFAAIYVIWGSTYLAIRYAIETLPPFLMAGMRFLLAGSVVYLWARLRGTPAPTRRHWRTAAVIGGLLLLGGNGGVTWAEQTVPSGIAALLITSVPIWMVLLNWSHGDGARPTLAESAGVIIGFAGVMVLVGSGDLAGGRSVDRMGALVLILAALSWSVGSLYARGAKLPESQLLGTAMEMLAGGAMLFGTGLLCGEAGQVGLDTVSLKSLVAMLYLVVFGSLIGFTAYVWLLKVTTPAKVSTYAFVNPTVAVVLGCVLGGEPFSTRILLAAAVIVGAVVLITVSRARSAIALTQPVSAKSAASEPPPGRDHSACPGLDRPARQAALAVCQEV
jgi:drug/metabolite transporter (DMT)-like permease